MTALLVESWIWWSVVMLVAFSRFISRRMALGSIRKFQADDYLMAIVLCFYTTLISTINIVRNTSSNLLPPGFDLNSLTKSNIQERQYGSKLILVVEQCQCVTIWGVKGCLVLLYLRLTSIHRENVAIKILGAYVVITFMVMDTLYFGVWCQPFHEYWAVPTDSRQCDAATNHLITNAVFNLTSDLAMILIVLPIFLRMKLPWRKKVPLLIIFSLGIFTILAAVLNKVYSFSEPFGALWTYWYTRESSTALLVANLPFVWTLWRRIPGVRVIMGTSKYTQKDDTFADAPRQDSKAGAPANELEMQGVPIPERQLSLAEILGERNPASVSEKEPTPVTHPHLFYSRGSVSAGAGGDDILEKAILRDSPARSTIRRDSSLDEREREGAGERAGTEKFPSMSSKKSTGSFV